MQSLRDKLLKAGAVSKKEARKSRQEQRQKKQKGKAGQRQATAAEQRREQRFAEKQSAQAEASRQVQAQLKAAQEEHEAEDRLKNIIDRHTQWKTKGPGRPFFVVMPDRKVRRLEPNFQIAQDLTAGRLGVVYAAHDPVDDARIVDAEGIKRLIALAPERVLFYNAPGNEEELPSFGAAGPREPN